MKDIPESTWLVSSSTLKLAKEKGIINSEWNGTYISKDRLHAYIMHDHKMYVNVHLLTSHKEFPRWTYRIDSLKDAVFYEDEFPIWFPNHFHTDMNFQEYHNAYEAGLHHALKMIEK